MGAVGPAGPAGPQGPSGTAGQSATTLVSQGHLMFGLGDGGPAFVPGLFGTITTPGQSVVVFSSNGGIVNTGVPGDDVRVIIRLIVDSVVQEFGEYDVENGKFSNMGRWSFSVAVPLSAGDHTVGVQAQLSGIDQANPSTGFPHAFVGETAGSPSHGTLTAVVLKQ